MPSKTTRQISKKTLPKKKANVARPKKSLGGSFKFSKLQLGIVAGILALVAIVIIFYAMAATPSPTEAETWTASGGGVKTVAVNDNTVGSYVEFLAPTPTPTSAPTDRGPVSYSTLDQAKAALGAPADANYVVWNPAWPKDRDLEDVFYSLGANDILVLPERPEPYIIDSSEGFRAAGVASVTGRNGQLPIVNRYKGIRSARTWFAMARARRGIIGMGPNARIEMSQSAWKMEPQIEDKGSVQADGWVSPGRFYIRTDGTQGGELVGSQEKVIEAESSTPFFGNFRMKGRDLGGIAYNGIATKGGKMVRIDISGGWRGFQAVPNGEAGGLTVNGGNYLISKCIVGTRDDTGKRVGSSPIMINNSSGGTIEDTDASESVAGMLTIWNSTGTHTLKNVSTKFNYGPGINLEKNQTGLVINWIGGSIWSDYKGLGDKTPKPADQGTRGAMHLNLFTEGASAKITLKDIDIDRGLTPGAVNIQAYGANQQKLSDITAFDKSGNPIPIKAYGTMK